MRLEDCIQLRVVRGDPAEVVLEIGSGNYLFEAKEG
jgi:hypothetical protein